jgi:hypothetical protein
MRTLVLLSFLISSVALSVELPSREIPNPEALTSWTKHPYIVDSTDFANLKTKLFTCADKMLTPMSTDQSTKIYHLYEIASYDNAKLRGDSEACVTASPTGHCLKGDTVEYTVMSDTFSDSCGNTYRAFWEVLFLTKNESMGTLCSLGRTFYEKANTEFPGEVEVGPTYPVEAKRFLFFTELFPKDL